MAFYDWIAHFKNIQLPIGDLARDILNDKEFPKQSVLFSSIYEYLLSKNANEKVLDTFRKVYTLYSFENI